MFLMIVGSGAMGQMVYSCAKEDETFKKIFMVEPLKSNWPKEKVDLIIDFSHFSVVKDIYEYCREWGGGIPVILGTTGQGEKEESVIELLRKICPVYRKTNFSRGVETMLELVQLSKELLPESDISIEEVHHVKKIDMPSGTAKTLCSVLDKDYHQVASLRMGTVPGTHSVYFALDDEIIEITHRAFSKKIFAIGALEAGKKLVKNNKI